MARKGRGTSSDLRDASFLQRTRKRGGEIVNHDVEMPRVQ